MNKYMLYLRKFFPLIFLGLSFFILFYTFYKAEIIWNGEKKNFYLPYYIISVFSIIFSISVFFFSDRTKDYLMIILSSILISLYLSEAYITLGFHKKENLDRIKIYQEITGKEYDLRSKIQVYNDIKKINPNVTVSTFPIYFYGQKTNIFPFSGISNSQTIHCNENGYYSIFKSDRYGFNNPDNEWDQQEIEYLLVGDSYTLGACVNQPNDISSILRKLSNKSVLNIGYDDNGPLIEYASMREYLRPNVKKILWIYYEGNDLNSLGDKLSNKLLKKYLNDLTFSQNLKKRQPEIDKAIFDMIERKKDHNPTEIDRMFFVKRFLKLYQLRAFLRFQQEAELIPEFTKIIELANNLSNENRSKLYFVYLPDYRRYKNNFNYTNYSKIKEIIKTLDIPFIDIHLEVFLKEENPLKLFPFESVGHYNEEGYRKVAQKIFELAK